MAKDTVIAALGDPDARAVPSAAERRHVGWPRAAPEANERRLSALLELKPFRNKKSTNATHAHIYLDCVFFQILFYFLHGQPASGNHGAALCVPGLVLRVCFQIQEQESPRGSCLSPSHWFHLAASTAIRVLTAGGTCFCPGAER